MGDPFEAYANCVQEALSNIGVNGVKIYLEMRAAYTTKNEKNINNSEKTSLLSWLLCSSVLVIPTLIP
jgi:hypothetical protein